MSEIEGKKLSNRSHIDTGSPNAPDQADGVSAPLSASVASGGVEKRVAGMMGALLTRLDEVTGGDRSARLPEPPAPPSQASEPSAAFGALRAAPNDMREVARNAEMSQTQREAIEDAADVIEEHATMRQEVVFRSDK